MPKIQYSSASILDSGQRPQEQLIYMTSATYGDDWEYMLHSHSFAEVFYVTSGSGLFCGDGTEIPIQKDSLVLINPNTQHTERPLGFEPLNYIIMGIDNLFFRFLSSKNASFQIYDFEESRTALLPILNLMLEEVRSKKQSCYEMCCHYLSSFFLKVIRMSENDFDIYSATHTSPECAAVKDYIKLHFSEDITLDMLAEFSGFNKYYLSKIFSKIYGTAPISYLLERRILHSEELLKTTNYSINQISEMVGFSSANYFSQSFKRYTGMTPMSFRETHFA